MSIRNSIALVTPEPLTGPANVRDLVRDWLEALDLAVRTGELAETSRRTYQIGAGKFIAWVEERGLVGADVIREWIADLKAKGFKPGTINTWLAGVRALFAWSVSMGRIPYNPASGIKGAKRSGTNSKHLRDALTDSEVMRVLNAACEDDCETPECIRDCALISIMAYAAARPIELHRANVEHLRTENGRLVLDVQGKGHAEADAVIVIAHPKAEHAVRRWIAVRGEQPGPLFVSMSHRTNGERLSLRGLREIVKQHYRNAGVIGARKTTHSLRHAAITNAVKRGAPVQKVQAMARHANISTTMIYYHETDRIEHPAEEFISYETESK